jgi:hypothetical protein
MELTEQQKQTIAGWVKEGCSLADIQRKILEHFGLSKTFMEVRFMVLDLGLQVKDRPAPVKAVAVEGKPGAGGGAKRTAGADDWEEEPEGAPAAAGGVTVTVDRVTKPGSVVSGSVTFSDGAKASWLLDQMGRLALQSERRDYRPSREDLAAFQRELQGALERQGF